MNAANEELLWEDKTVNGMIHVGGGPELTEACTAWVEKYGKVRTSDYAVTLGFNLPCRYVIHTVGPVYPCNRGAERELFNTYENVLVAATSPTFLYSIALPAISTGVFSYPFADATRIQILMAMKYEDRFSEIRLVYYTDEDLATAQHIYTNLKE